MNFTRRFSRWIPLLAAIALLLAFLPGCSGSASGQSANSGTMANMPDAVQKAPVEVREAYQFAVSNPAALKNVPCYCGCGRTGHTSNYDCYISGVKPSGEITFGQHALGCSLCVNIAQDVMRMTKDGKSPGDIRAAIEKTYSQYGPSNFPSGE
jgi:Protein of unknown function with PCYCGC motif